MYKGDAGLKTANQETTTWSLLLALGNSKSTNTIRLGAKEISHNAQNKFRSIVSFVVLVKVGGLATAGEG